MEIRWIRKWHSRCWNGGTRDSYQSSIAVSSSTVFGRGTQARHKLGNGCSQRPRQQDLIIYTWFLRDKIGNTWRKKSGMFQVRGQMEETISANVRTSGTLQTLICPNSRISGSAWLGTGPGLLVPETLTPWNCPPYQSWPTACLSLPANA